MYDNGYVRLTALPTEMKFSSVMAFGLYHSLPPELQDRAFSETKRILEKDGILVCSFRADNINTRISDWLRAKESRHVQREFHKLNLTKKEFNDILTKNGFSILKIEPVVNMPILYKYKLFRHKKHKIFNEHLGRKESYRFNLSDDRTHGGFTVAPDLRIDFGLGFHCADHMPKNLVDPVLVCVPAARE